MDDERTRVVDRVARICGRLPGWVVLDDNLRHGALLGRQHLVAVDQPVLVGLVDDDVHRYVTDTVGGDLGHLPGHANAPARPPYPCGRPGRTGRTISCGTCDRYQR